MILANRLSAIIALYSRLALPPHGFETYLDAMSPALERCLEACNDLASIVGAMINDDLQCTSPHFIFDMFVAARFFLGRPWTPGFGIKALIRLTHRPVNARAFETDLPFLSGHSLACVQRQPKALASSS